MRMRTLGILITPILIAGLAGCTLNPAKKVQQKVVQEKAEESLEKQGAGNVEVKVSEDQTRLKTDQGQVNISDKGEVSMPADFPTDVFVYDDAKLTYAASNDAGHNMISIMYYTATSTGDAISTYNSKMQENGWKKMSEMNAGEERGTVLYYTKNDRTVAVTVTQETKEGNYKDKTIVTVAQTVLQQ